MKFHDVDFDTYFRNYPDANGYFGKYGGSYIPPQLQAAMDETERRRKIQDAYNKEHNITPKTVKKAVRSVIEATKVAEEEGLYEGKSPLELTKKELKDYVRKLEKEMKQAAGDLQFERAAQLRDMIFEYKARM